MCTLKICQIAGLSFMSENNSKSQVRMKKKNPFLSIYACASSLQCSHTTAKKTLLVGSVRVTGAKPQAAPWKMVLLSQTTGRVWLCSATPGSHQSPLMWIFYLSKICKLKIPQTRLFPTDYSLKLSTELKFLKW